MKNKFEIIGSGMAGLLAGNMLRRHQPTIVESAPELPNNHSALLRFRTDAVSNATGIPFAPISVSKGIYNETTDRVVNEATIPLANQYSRKVTGEVHRRSVWNLNDEIRYLAPDNFIDQMARSLTIEYNRSIKRLSPDTTYISTIPMPTMMRLSG